MANRTRGDAAFDQRRKEPAPRLLRDVGGLAYFFLAHLDKDGFVEVK